MTPLYQYIVLHKSCGNLPGIAAVQAVHAATECLRELPVAATTHVCILQANTSADLEALAVRLTDNGIHHTIIREPDSPYNGAAVAVGIDIMTRELVRPHVSDFKAFR